MDWACSFLSNFDRIWGSFRINRTMSRQIHGQTFQDDAACPAPHMSQLVANHHILTEHGRILSDDHSPEEFLSGWMGQQVQSSVKSRKSNVRQACNRPYPLSLGVLPLAVAGLCKLKTSTDFYMSSIKNQVLCLRVISCTRKINLCEEHCKETMLNIANNIPWQYWAILCMEPFNKVPSWLKWGRKCRIVLRGGGRGKQQGYLKLYWTSK